jgi:predicted NBD/HSP70 family sugar kinase
MTTVRTGDHRLVREVNQALVLKLLRDECRSRTDLADATGLNRATIGKIVDQLLEEGLVRDAGTTSHGLGRPATLLEIDPAAGYLIGAELGVDYLDVILTDFSGRRLIDAQVDVAGEHGPTLAMRALERLVDEVIAAAGVPPTSVLGLGVSVCGLVDEESGTIVHSPNHGWSEVAIRADLARHHRFQVFIQNDAKISALGEEMFGIVKGEEDFVMVTGAAGIGVGIVTGGRLLRGSRGWAGEFGHMAMSVDGLPCRCGGRGCWETIASERALLTRLAELGGEDADYLLPGTELTKRWDRVARIARAAAAGDAVAAQAIRESGANLGLGIANIINALNPSVVVIGGSLSLAAELLLPEIRRVVADRAMHRASSVCRIEVAAYGIHSCAMGGVALAITELYTPSHLRVARPT